MVAKGVPGSMLKVQRLSSTDIIDFIDKAWVRPIAAQQVILTGNRER
jgi:hypothetical protein